jgi:hypothetical protein
MGHDLISDEDAIGFFRLALAANDREYVLWPPENAQFAVSTLQKVRGGVPGFEEVASIIGEERFQSLLPIIVEKRKLDNVFLGYRSPCHYCGAADGLTKFDFGLMCPKKSSWNWGEAAASLVLSAALLPMLGGGVVRLPGKSFRGDAVHLRLVVCESCRKTEGNIFGAFVLNEKNAAAHPLWSQLINAGFTKFLVRESLPDQFKYAAKMAL